MAVAFGLTRLAVSLDCSPIEIQAFYKITTKQVDLIKCPFIAVVVNIIRLPVYMQKYFRELIEGKRTGLQADVLRFMLSCCEKPYFVASSTRNAFYDRGWFRSRQVPIPIVSVGNLTLGGTGKTPMVAYLVKWFLSHKIRPGIVSRGYKKPSDSKTPGKLNDEGMELEIRFPEVPHLQSPDRIAASLALLQKYPVDVIVLDDGFQHRRIARNLDIVLIDSLEPFGLDRLFPRGTLRESLHSLSRADVVLISRADMVDESRRNEIQSRVRKFTPNAIIGEVIHKPTSLIAHYEETPQTDSSLFSDMSTFTVRQTCSVAWLAGKKIVAFSGIARPEAFRKSLERCGANVLEFVHFPDHHDFSSSDVERLTAIAKAANAAAVLCTMKDIVKIRKRNLDNVPLWSVEIGLEFQSGEEQFAGKLRSIVVAGG